MYTQAWDHRGVPAMHVLQSNVLSRNKLLVVNTHSGSIQQVKKEEETKHDFNHGISRTDKQTQSYIIIVRYSMKTGYVSGFWLV